MRRLLFILAAGSLLPACGGGDNSTARLPAEEYVRSADALCGELARDVTELDAQQRIRVITEGSGSDSEKLRALADVMAEQLQIVSEFRQDVEALGLPDEHSDDVEQILDKTRGAESELQRAIESARAGDGDEFAQAMSRYGGFSLQSASIARDSELGFAICGAGARS